VLALCTDTPRPHEKLLTRALGVGRKWLAVGTLAAVGSAIYWAKTNLFADVPIERFRKELFRLSRLGPKAAGGVRFEPYMAGERTSIEQRTGAFTGLTLASTREQMLSAVVEALTRGQRPTAAAAQGDGTKLLKQVVVSGGASTGILAPPPRLAGRVDVQGRHGGHPPGLGAMTPRD
jgi:sugar (pentulose or hexulose) kinase